MIDVKAAREQLGMTQAELGEMVGVSTRTVQNWEGGVTSPTERQAQIIARIVDAIPAKTGTVSRLISIIESQQRVIETLTREHSI